MFKEQVVYQDYMTVDGSDLCGSSNDFLTLILEREKIKDSNLSIDIQKFCGIEHRDYDDFLIHSVDNVNAYKDLYPSISFENIELKIFSKDSKKIGRKLLFNISGKRADIKKFMMEKHSYFAKEFDEKFPSFYEEALKEKSIMRGVFRDFKTASHIADRVSCLNRLHNTTTIKIEKSFFNQLTSFVGKYLKTPVYFKFSLYGVNCLVEDSLNSDIFK